LRRAGEALAVSAAQVSWLLPPLEAPAAEAQETLAAVAAT
jgi:hypothetical protein